MKKTLTKKDIDGILKDFHYDKDGNLVLNIMYRENND